MRCSAALGTRRDLQSLTLTGNTQSFHAFKAPAGLERLEMDMTFLDMEGLERVLASKTLQVLSIVDNKLSWADLYRVNWAHPSLKTLVLGGWDKTDDELRAYAKHVRAMNPGLQVAVNNGHIYLPRDE